MDLEGSARDTGADAGGDTGVDAGVDSGPEGLCEDTCFYPSDGECDDGGPGAATSMCAYGTDCGDCGARIEPLPSGHVRPEPAEIASDASLASLQGITEIDGYLTIRGSGVTSLRALGSLQKISGSLTIEGTSLETLEGLCNLVEVDDLYIGSNPELRDLDCLISLERVRGSRPSEGKVRVQNNTRLGRVDGLRNLEEVGGSFQFSQNPLLQAIEGIDPWTGNSVYIKWNGSLSRISGFERGSGAATIEVSSNPSLVEIDAFSALESVAYDFEVADNDSLERLDGLESLETVGEDFIIRDNPKLPQCRVDAIESGLREVSGSISTNGNDDTALCP